MKSYENPEFDNYPPVQPKPKINWQKVWNSFADGFGRVFGWASVSSIVAAIVFGIIATIGGCASNDTKFKEWTFGCAQAGNRVVYTEGDVYCMSNVSVLFDDGGSWTGIDRVACTKQDGLVAYLAEGRSYKYICVTGQVVSRKP